MKNPSKIIKLITSKIMPTAITLNTNARVAKANKISNNANTKNPPLGVTVFSCFIFLILM
jgi:hypothetical protein